MAVKITYFGGMAFLLERSDGYRVLCDPCISQSRITKHSPSEFYDVDLVLVTHAAFDHFGDTIDLMKNGRASLICGPEVKRMVLEALPDLEKTRVKSAGYGEKISFDGKTTVRCVTAFHPSNVVENGVHSVFQPFGFVIALEEGVTFYHTGDTSIFSDMKLIRDLYHPNLMNVGIANFSPRYGIQMTPHEAALATSWISPDVVFPSHYPDAESPEIAEFVRQTDVLAPQVKVHVPADQTVIYHPARIEIE